MASENDKQQNGNYGADAIQVLDGIKAVRQVPAMYIGSTGPTGLHHLIKEVVDNSVDEAMGGFCKEIDVVLHADGSCSVQDDGRGIPVAMHKDLKKPAVEIALTVLHAGGKFNKSAYGNTGGLHGVGVSCVNALSTTCTVIVDQQGKKHEIGFERGVTTSPLKVIGKSSKTGTYVRFLPDPEIFTNGTDFSYETVASHLRRIAFLNAGLRLTLTDERSAEVQKDEFFYEQGIAEMIAYLNRSRAPIHPEVMHFTGEVEGVSIDIALQYNEGWTEDLYTFANNIPTTDGGTHLTGFRSALTRVMNEVATESKQFKSLKLTGDDTREGLTAVVAVRLPHAQFEGQTKGKLNNGEVRGIVEGFMSDRLRTHFAENPKTVKAVLEKLSLSVKAREKASAARDAVRGTKSDLFADGRMPGKLADCSIDDPASTELFLVEGDSAGGSAKQGRDRSFQAILALRGKVLNVEKVEPTKVLRNEEIKNIITALGCYDTDRVDLSRLRYHKIFIMTDADVDGSHIRILLLTLFFRYFRDLIEQRHIYIAMPPLFRVAKGKKEEYCYTIEQRDEAITRLGGADGKSCNVQRYKGLGEMNPSQLWGTTMDPEKRRMQVVTIEDAQVADELFSSLMGESPEARRRFLDHHAKYVKNLDI